MLEPLGLTGAAGTVYSAMLINPTWGVAELASYAGLSVAEVHLALDELAELELVRRTSDAPGQVRVMSPHAGLTLLLARAEADVKRRQQEIESTRAAIAAIAAEYDRSRERDVMIRLESLVDVRERLRELALTAKHECLSFSPGAAHNIDAMEASKPLNQNALERGVAIRAVYQDSFRNDVATHAYAQWLTLLGGQMRTVPTVPMQLVIVDREVAMLPIDPGDPRHGAVEVHSPGVVAALCALFDETWARGTPFGDVAPTDERGLTPQERELVRLLAEGHTDESAGRKLGLSKRSVQRMMADLMARLEAESRFQSGVNAARRGWL